MSTLKCNERKISRGSNDLYFGGKISHVECMKTNFIKVCKLLELSAVYF